MKQKEMSSLLRALADWLDMATPADIKKLTDGKARFTLETKADRTIHERHEQSRKIDLREVRARLERANSIEEGLHILREEGIAKQKKPLEELARSYQVGVRKSESIPNLAHRIVSAVVGSRLQSEITRKLSL